MYRAVYPYFVSCLLCLAIPSLNGCNRAGGGPGGMGGPAIIAPPEVITDLVEKDDVQIYIYAAGRTVPSEHVEIRARVGGFLEKLYFEPGAIVKEGDKLALIEQEPYIIALNAAEAELESRKAQLSLAEATLARTKALFDRGVATVEDVQTHQANYDVALASVALANSSVRNAKLNLDYTDIRSPITGKTTKYFVDVGNYVNPSGSQAVLLSITKNDPMFVEFTLSDRQFTELKDRMGFRDAFREAVRTGTKVTEGDASLALTGIDVGVSLQTGVNVFKFDFDIDGTIVTSVDNQISTSTGQITLRAEVQNPLLQLGNTEDYMIYSGQTCRVRIPYETVKDAVLVREEAILTDLDVKYVLLVSREMYQPTDAYGQPLLGNDGEPIPPYETDIVHRRDVKPGRLLDSQKRIILEGLQPGEAYIVHGVQRVRIGTEVQPTTLEEYNKRRAAETEADSAQ